MTRGGTKSEERAEFWRMGASAVVERQTFVGRSCGCQSVVSDQRKKCHAEGSVGVGRSYFCDHGYFWMDDHTCVTTDFGGEATEHRRRLFTEADLCSERLETLMHHTFVAADRLDLYSQ